MAWLNIFIANSKEHLALHKMSIINTIIQYVNHIIKSTHQVIKNEYQIINRKRIVEENKH